MTASRNSSKPGKPRSTRIAPSYEEQIAELGLVAATTVHLEVDLAQDADCDPDGYVRSSTVARPAYDAIVSKVIEDNASPWDPPGGPYKIGIVASDRKTIYRIISVSGFGELLHHVEPLVRAGFENILANLQDRRWDAILVPTLQTVAGLLEQEPKAGVGEAVDANAPREAKGLSVPTALEDLEAAAEQLRELPSSEREQVVMARVGQGRFRLALVTDFGGHCGLTGFDFEPVLRASHIKPWNAERLDANNGLLLRADIDALFDAGYISFRDSGELLRSTSLPETALRDLTATSANLRLPEALLTPTRLKFLEHHRAHVFLGCQPV